jgi:hypothetical protein
MRRDQKKFRSVAEVREHFDIPAPSSAWAALLRNARSEPDDLLSAGDRARPRSSSEEKNKER